MSQEPAEPPARPRPVVRPVRYQAFVGTGAAVGLLVAVVLVVTAPPDGSNGAGASLGYVAAFLGLLGALIGGLAAVLVDSAQQARIRRGSRRGRPPPPAAG